MPRLKEAKKSIVAALLQAGIDPMEAAKEAELIVEHVLALPLAGQILQAEEELKGSDWAQIETIISQRQRRMPLQLCFGYAYFDGMKLKCKHGVFIPRSDTETLIEVALPLLAQAHDIAEIGVGTGAICLSLIRRLPDLKITGIDISQAACQLTQENAAALPEELNALSRLQLVCADWPSALPMNLDAIVSNPPYIPPADKAKLLPEVKDWDPDQALYGNSADGLSFYRHLAEKGKAHLKPNGFVALEVGDGQGQAVCGIFASHGWQQVLCHQDLNGLDRVVTARV